MLGSDKPVTPPPPFELIRHMHSHDGVGGGWLRFFVCPFWTTTLIGVALQRVHSAEDGGRKNATAIESGVLEALMLAMIKYLQEYNE